MRKRKKKKSVTPNALTPKQRLFAVARAGGMTNIEAMRAAKYSGTPNTLSVQANRLLKIPKIAAYIESHLKKDEADVEMDASKLLSLAFAIANSDLADYTTWDNDKLMLKLPDEIPIAKRRAIKSIRIKDTAFGKDRSILLHDKGSVIDRLGTYFKLWGDKLTVEFPGDKLDRGLFAIPGFDTSGAAVAKP